MHSIGKLEQGVGDLEAPGEGEDGCEQKRIDRPVAICVASQVEPFAAHEASCGKRVAKLVGVQKRHPHELRRRPVADRGEDDERRKRQRQRRPTARRPLHVRPRLDEPRLNDRLKPRVRDDRLRFHAPRIPRRAAPETAPSFIPTATRCRAPAACYASASGTPAAAGAARPSAADARARRAAAGGGRRRPRRAPLPRPHTPRPRRASGVETRASHRPRSSAARREGACRRRAAPPRARARAPRRRRRAPRSSSPIRPLRSASYMSRVVGGRRPRDVLGERRALELRLVRALRRPSGAGSGSTRSGTSRGAARTGCRRGRGCRASARSRGVRGG